MLHLLHSITNVQETSLHDYSHYGKCRTQRRTKVSSLYKYCIYFSRPKGMCQDEVTSNSEEIKPIALSIVELHLAEGIS